MRVLTPHLNLSLTGAESVDRSEFLMQGKGYQRTSAKGRVAAKKNYHINRHIIADGLLP